MYNTSNYNWEQYNGTDQAPTFTFTTLDQPEAKIKLDRPNAEINASSN